MIIRPVVTFKVKELENRSIQPHTLIFLQESNYKIGINRPNDNKNNNANNDLLFIAPFHLLWPLTYTYYCYAAIRKSSHYLHFAAPVKRQLAKCAFFYIYLHFIVIFPTTDSSLIRSGQES